jgi:hypothetical protein
MRSQSIYEASRSLRMLSLNRSRNRLKGHHDGLTEFDVHTIELTVLLYSKLVFYCWDDAENAGRVSSKMFLEYLFLADTGSPAFHLPTTVIIAWLLTTSILYESSTSSLSIQSGNPNQ